VHTMRKVAILYAVLLLVHFVVGDISPKAVNPTPSGNYYLFDSFDDNAWASRWVQSENPKYTGEFGGMIRLLKNPCSDVCFGIGRTLHH
jgi:hypothetical protein